MIKYYCDRCGKLVEEARDLEKITLRLSSYAKGGSEIKKEKFVKGIYEINICWDCERSFDETFDNE